MAWFSWLERSVLSLVAAAHLRNVPCSRCGTMIQSGTAGRAGGLCLPCDREKGPPSLLEKVALEEIMYQPSPTLSMDQYRALLADVPLPTKQQKENFVEYASHAHSWYKHLPLCPPGVFFNFFIDKYAGWDRLPLGSRRAGLYKRTHEGFLRRISIGISEYLQSAWNGPSNREGGPLWRTSSIVAVRCGSPRSRKNG